MTTAQIKDGSREAVRGRVSQREASRRASARLVVKASEKLGRSVPAEIRRAATAK